MNKTEAAEATAAIGLMLKAFPSSQSNITDDSARVYLFAVEDMSLESVKRACRMFVRGEVKGRNNSFAPSAPELVDQCKVAEGLLKVEQYEAGRIFIECDSEMWRRMEIAKRDTNLLSCTRHGKRGWFFLPEDVAQAEMVSLPAPLTEEQMAANAERTRQLLKVGTFNTADDDAHDMGGLGAEAAA